MTSMYYRNHNDTHYYNKSSNPMTLLWQK